MQGSQTRSTVPSYLAWSIINMLCCCLPIGIAAVIYSCKVDNANNSGNATEAQEASRVAKILNIVGVVIGVIFLIIVIAVYAAGGNKH